MAKKDNTRTVCWKKRKGRAKKESAISLDAISSTVLDFITQNRCRAFFIVASKALNIQPFVDQVAREVAGARGQILANFNSKDFFNALTKHSDLLYVHIDWLHDLFCDDTSLRRLSEEFWQNPLGERKAESTILPKVVFVIGEEMPHIIPTLLGQILSTNDYMTWTLAVEDPDRSSGWAG